MSPQTALLELLEDTLVLRAGILGCQVDAALLSGLDPQPSAVFAEVLSTGDCSQADIVAFITGLKGLKEDGGQPIMTAQGLESLANELWRIQWKNAKSSGSAERKQQTSKSAPQHTSDGVRTKDGSGAGLEDPHSSRNEDQAGAAPSHIVTPPGPKYGYQTNGGNAEGPGNGTAPLSTSRNSHSSPGSSPGPRENGNEYMHAPGGIRVDSQGANRRLVGELLASATLQTVGEVLASVPSPHSDTPATRAGPGKKRKLCGDVAKGGTSNGNDPQSPKLLRKTARPHPTWACPAVKEWVEQILEAVSINGTLSLSELGCIVPRPSKVSKQKNLKKILDGYKTWFLVDGDKVRRKPEQNAGVPQEQIEIL